MSIGDTMSKAIKISYDKVVEITGAKPKEITDFLTNKRRRISSFDPDTLYTLAVFIVLRRMTTMCKRNAYKMSQKIMKSSHCDYWFTYEGEEWKMSRHQPNYGRPYVYVDVHYIARKLETELEK